VYGGRDEETKVSEEIFYTVLVSVAVVVVTVLLLGGISYALG